MATASPACRVILIGMMGSGKTTIGHLLSEETGWPYVDNDELVQRSHGLTSRKIVARQGEAKLREAETSALALGLELSAPVIIGVAAGTILDPANRHRMEVGGIVVWLRADAATLVSRAMDLSHRPFVHTAGGDWLAATVSERMPLYRSVANLIVDTDAGTPDDAVRTIRAHVESIPACRDVAVP